MHKFSIKESGTSVGLSDMFRALYTMCLNHPTMRKKIGDAGACGVVLQTIVEFQDSDRRIVLTACNAIIQLSFDVDNGERFVDCSPIDSEQIC